MSAAARFGELGSSVCVCVCVCVCTGELGSSVAAASACEEKTQRLRRSTSWLSSRRISGESSEAKDSSCDKESHRVR